MGATKRIAEIFANCLNGESKTKFVATRFGNVLGSNGSVIPLFRKQIEEGGPILVTHKDIERYFMTIPEACQLVLEAGAMGEGGEIFVFDMGESMKIYDVAKKMIKLAGLKVGKDIEIKIIGLRPGEKLYEELLTNKENCIKTHHPKIMKALIDNEDSVEMSSKINMLINETQIDTNDMAIVKFLKSIVPEYVSNNSRFELLDEKQETDNSLQER
jgi:FlaA1/EpsC-like NDP-sugar epimerase